MTLGTSTRHVDGCGVGVGVARFVDLGCLHQAACSGLIEAFTLGPMVLMASLRS